MFKRLRDFLKFGVALVAIGSQPTWAALIAYEGFTPSFPVFANGGTGFSGPWTVSGSFSSYIPGDGSLCYPKLPSSSGSISAFPMNSTGTYAVANRILAQPIGADNTTVYISFLIQPTGPFSSQEEYFGLSFGGLFVGKPGMGANQQYVIETFGGTGQVPSGKPALAHRNALLVVKIQFLPGNDLVTLYVDPTPGQPEPSSGVSKSDLDLGMVSTIQTTSGMFTSGVTMDEIRVGTTFADVVPAVSFPAAILNCLSEN